MLKLHVTSCYQKQRGNVATLKNLKTMSKIINNTDYTLSASAQQEVRNAMANAGKNTVTVSVSETDGGNGTQFDCYDENENYVFSIDTEGNVIFEK